MLAGLIISAQYFATLFSRPHAGRYADQLGPKKVVLFGLACCGVSGLFYALAFGVDGYPWLSLLLLCAGGCFRRRRKLRQHRFHAVGHRPGRGDAHRAGDFWNGVATYGAMAAGRRSAYT